MSTPKQAWPAIWIVDSLDVAHTHRCSVAVPPSVDYLTKARTATDLIANLARPDSHERHSAPSRLKYCASCIGDMAEIEGNSK